MDTQFKIGDVVKLKSGGPNMTIDHYWMHPISGDISKDIVVCYWFIADEQKKGRFAITSLESAS